MVERVRPEIDGGRFPIKRTVGEPVQVTAWIHADGHDTLAAVLRYRSVPARGKPPAWVEAPMQPLGNDEWAAGFVIDQYCPFEYTVEAWVDGFQSWRHALVAKVGAGQDVASELLEGAALVRAAARRARGSRATDAAHWLDAQADRVDGTADLPDRVAAAQDSQLARLVGQFPDRTFAAEYGRALRVSVDRERARFGAWYEMFPRSWGPDPERSATLREAAVHLDRVAAMGFDVVYLPPIHPIGTSFRKGRGNALSAGAGDPGSPWAIGSRAGGHKAVDPGLGTLDDFDHFVGEARRLGLEVALDLAYQCSPDHPYVREHPEWFRHRPDGTIKYAENPPKKYQDIYPLDFECEAWPALWAELKSIVEFWIAHGVAIFRVDNPHTKPYRFWEWLICEIRAEHPDVIFLAEAFTRPKVMGYLAKLGFTQSYTYFTWRNTKQELTEYFTELTRTEAAEFFRPNLFANTPDILHAYLQQGGPPAFRTRLTLAATLGATYGIYSGFELCENRAVTGTEEYLDSEKYQFRCWDVDRPGHITDLVTSLNRIRRANPALHANDGLRFCETDNPNLIAFYKIAPDRSNAILVVVNLDYEHLQHGVVQVPTGHLGLSPTDAYEVADLLDDARYTWRGEWNYVKLDPPVRAAHVFALPVAAPEIISVTGRALARFLPRQRWFAGKARAIENVRLVDWSPCGSEAADLVPAMAEVEYADGGREPYFTPLAVVPADDARAGGGTIAGIAGHAVVDAVQDDRACLALLSAMRAGRSIPMRLGTARGTAYRHDDAPAGPSVVRRGGEQSNSSVRFDDRYVMKLLRRMESGPHPELELSRFLEEQGFTKIPPLIASLAYERPGEAPGLLAVLHGFVVNDGTGWDHAAEDVRRFLALDAPQGATAFLPLAAILGRRTAELHRALAASAADPAFAQLELSEDDVAAMVARLQLDAERALALLAERLPSLPAPARDLADAVLGAHARLDASITAFAGAAPCSLRTRVHGDYHLGQVLVAGGDFVIIDFEGEPDRPLAERRAKESPLRDVAGMLRSFSYAAFATLKAAAADRPDLAARLEPAARVWEASVSATFLTNYLETAAGARLVPADQRCADQWLDAFLLQKALYELRYELASRPHWVDIPLSGILRILNAPQPLNGSR